ncbi:hypothetical protein ACN5ZK_06480 [Macrococcoides bohemicum]|uniref:hypothetical protein n=1 Tax=Macrococcoides bohemicum TaxID=1903056 RepID=UPI000BB55CB8|nr:hypothetical protein [Macrococcus sp. IME1552]ATD31101.1 hypothetical protein BHM04_07830 [Macrococcus sp. IME1552]
MDTVILREEDKATLRKYKVDLLEIDYDSGAHGYRKEENKFEIFKFILGFFHNFLLKIRKS